MADRKYVTKSASKNRKLGMMKSAKAENAEGAKEPKESNAVETAEKAKGFDKPSSRKAFGKYGN